MIPQTLLDTIRRFEGCKLNAYLCPAGVWTCGWGATGPDVVKGTVWTQEQADTRLIHDATRFMFDACAQSPVLWFDENKRSAITDFCFNLGTSRYKASTLRRRVNAGDWEGAQEELQKWVWGGGKKLPGLVLRRHEEGLLLNRD